MTANPSRPTPPASCAAATPPNPGTDGLEEYGGDFQRFETLAETVAGHILDRRRRMRAEESPRTLAARTPGESGGPPRARPR